MYIEMVDETGQFLSCNSTQEIFDLLLKIGKRRQRMAVFWPNSVIRTQPQYRTDRPTRISSLFRNILELDISFDEEKSNSKIWINRNDVWVCFLFGEQTPSPIDKAHEQAEEVQLQL